MVRPLRTILKGLVAVAMFQPVPSFAQDDRASLCDRLSELQSLSEPEVDLTESATWQNRDAPPDDMSLLDGLRSVELPRGYLYFKIGECYFWGRGVVKDRNIARDYFERASSRGYEQADHFVASILLFQSDDPEEQRRGLEMLQAEFEAGSWYAAGKLGWAYQRGLGVDPDLNKALELYRGAARRGGTYWQYLLSHAHEMGYLGLEQSEEQAAYWLGLPKTHIDTYDCWVHTYYSNGIFPSNEQLQKHYETRCADPVVREQELDRILSEQNQARERDRPARVESADSSMEGG